MNLASLFAKYGTDKLGNGYAGLYESLLDPRRANVERLLEVGIGTMIPNVKFTMAVYPGYKPGASLRAWRDWLPNAEIFGMDPQPDCMITDEPRITTLQCSSLDKAWIDATICEMLFDVIIDDGSHWHADQICTLTYLFPHLRPGGVYVIEDLPNDQMWHARNGLWMILGAPMPYFFARFEQNQVLIIHRPFE